MTTSRTHSQPQPDRARSHRGRWRQRHHFAAVTGLALVAGLALTGCTPTDAPPTAATGPATAPASTAAPATTSDAPSPTPVYKPATASGPAQNVPVPVLPAKAREFSKAGLEAFATYWYSTLGYAYESGNTGPVRAITDPGCATCTDASRTIDDWYREGGWIVGGLMVVHSATSTFSESPDGSYQAILLIHQQRVVSYKSDKTPDNDIPAMTPRADIVVANYSAGHWTALKAEHLTKD